MIMKHRFFLVTFGVPNCKYICQKICKNVQWSEENSTHEKWRGTDNFKQKQM